MRPVPRDWRIVLLVAVAVRAVFVAETRGDPLFSLLVLDARSYLELAQRFAGGDWLYGRDPLWFAPLYPTLLGTLFRAIGPRPEWAIVLQHLLGAATAALAAATAGRISRRAGLTAGLLLAVHPVLVFYESQLLYTSLAVFLTAAFLARFLAGAPGQAGLLLGLLGLVRSNALLFLPVGAVLLWHAAGPRRAAVFVAAALAVLAPVLLRNGLVSGAWTPLTVNGGMIFATGFAEGSLGGRALQRRPEDFGPDGAFHREAQRALGREVSLAEASDYHRAQAIARIRAEPGEALRLTLRKAWLLATAREIDDNLSLPAVAGRARTLDWLPAPWAWLALPAAAGAAAAFRMSGTAGAMARGLTLYSAIYCASLLLFFVNSRYRLPLAVPGALLAGVGVEAIVRAARRGDRLVPGLAAGAAALLAWPVLSDPGVRADPALGWVAVAAALERDGRHEEALALTDRAIAASPGIAGAHQNRAVSLLALGRSEEALAAAREAARLDPDLAPAWQTQGAVLARAGQIAEALPAFRRAAELAPSDAGVLVNLARALAATGEPAEAAAVGRRAVAAGARGLEPLVAEWERAAAEAPGAETPGAEAQAPGPAGR
jgi:tetratricopeptide (TPR) repeat protein